LSQVLANSRVAAAPVRLRTGGIGLQRHLVHGPFQGFFGLVAEFKGEFTLGHAPEPAFKIPLEAIITRVSDQFVQITGNRAHVLGDAPFVVIQNADEPVGRVRNVVERLEGNSVGQGGIAKNRHDIFVAPSLIARGGHAQRRG